MLARTLLAAATLVLAACATQDDFITLRKEMFRNEEGKVVGHRETLRSKSTGDIVNRVELYAAVTDSEGKVIGYEARTRSGAIVYDADGQPIGTRLLDLRSKGTNPAGRGVILMY